jgi:hypothetical protein
MLSVQVDKQLRSMRVQCPKIGRIANGTSDPQKMGASALGHDPCFTTVQSVAPTCFLEVKPLAWTSESRKQMGHFLLQAAIVSELIRQKLSV